MQVTQSCLTLCNPMDYTVHVILQARLEWVVAYPFSSRVSCIAGRFFSSWATRKGQKLPCHIWKDLACCNQDLLQPNKIKQIYKNNLMNFNIKTNIQLSHWRNVYMYLERCGYVNLTFQLTFTNSRNWSNICTKNLRFKLRCLVNHNIYTRFHRLLI